MASLSLSEEVQEMEKQVRQIVSFLDPAELPRVQQDLLNTIKYQIVDARLDARDYEYAQTRADQLKHAQAGRKRLEQLERSILKASEYNLFGAVDVAHISARLEHIRSMLE